MLYTVVCVSCSTVDNVHSPAHVEQFKGPYSKHLIVLAHQKLHCYSMYPHGMQKAEEISLQMFI